MYILPIPQKMTEKDTKFTLCNPAYTADDEKILSFIKDNAGNGGYPVEFCKCESDKPEYYTVNASKDGTKITYCTLEGAYRAYTTFLQILRQSKNGEINEVEIEDWPAIRNRGYMLDISRGKLPKLDYLKKVADIMASLKYNEFQLYLDAIVVEYKNFPEYVAETETLSRAEIRELAEYCKERFIKLVPNQNTFGHMAAWMAKKELAGLAITDKDGKPSQTLNPLKPESAEFVGKLLDGYIELFDTDRVNIGMDETIDLGKNETKEVCDRLGVGKVYTDYLRKICSLVTDKYGKAPMFWDDIIFKHPEQLENVPSNAIVMQWGYETEHHFDRNCRRISERGLRFYVCPGTSMWGSYTGRSNNSLLNITTAAECGDYYGAEGFLLTEWGDGGHPQFPATTYYPMVLGAAASWNCGSHDYEIAYDQRRTMLGTVKNYLDDVLYKAEPGFADIVYRMGNYYLLDENLRFNGTDLYHLIRNQNDITDNHRKIYRKVYDYMKELRGELCALSADETAKSNILLNCDIVMMACRVITEGKNTSINPEIDRITGEFEKLWLADNHRTGLEIFTEFLKSNKA